MEKWLKQTKEEVCVDCIVKPICSCKCENFLISLKRKCKTITFQNGNYVINPVFVDYNDGVGVQMCGGNIYSPSGKAIGHIDSPGRRGYVGHVGKK